MEIIGHRGVMGEMPQNTLPSFEKALKAGLTKIEFDAQLSRDGRVVIFHDDDMASITGGAASGPVSNLDFEDLRKLNVTDGLVDTGFFQIPTLEEVLDLVAKHNQGGRNHTTVNIELKSSQTAGPVAEIVNQYLQKGWAPADFVVSSFEHDELADFKKIMPEIKIAVLIDASQYAELGSADSVIKLARNMGAIAVNPGDGFVDRALVDAAHRAGLDVNVYTIKTAEQFRRMQQLGVDGVFVNYLGLEKAA